MWKEGWKVVADMGLGYESATSILATTDYGFGFPSRPPIYCGPLTVFTSQEGAEHFWNVVHNEEAPLKIFRCVYQPSNEDRVWNRSMYVALPVLYRFNKDCLLEDSVALAKEVVLLPPISIFD